MRIEHIAIWAEDIELRSDGYTILNEPRTSGDGYYESAVVDPEGNYVEIVA